MADLKRCIHKVNTLGSIADLLSWDEQVNLPSAAAEQRAAQMSVLADVRHAGQSDPAIGALLTELEAEPGISPDERLVTAEARREYDRATRLPAEYVREKAEQDSRAYHAWAKAKAADDFPSYAPVLEKNLALVQREAAYLGWEGRSYDYMIDRHDPGMNAATIAALFAELKQGLVPLVRAIMAAPRLGPVELHGLSVEGQKTFLREVTTRLGFDYERGRLDVSLHPFCSGTGSDVRMTTRFKEHAPLDSLFSSIHETGHGLYEQGLPTAWLGTALGIHAGMAVHESQSRLWENQVARSRAFWSFFEPRFREIFPAQTAAISSDELYLAVNAVKPTLIRVDADEVTYNLHIILRFELEQKLFSSDLAVRDLPAAWRAASRDLLGLEPANDREGVLQDVHWSGGAFGYFPSYCLGNMLAAQLWYTALEQHPSLEADFAHGDFSWLLLWLRSHVHSQGRRYSLGELAKRVTGEPLSPRHLLRYLRERYGAIYLG